MPTQVDLVQAEVSAATHTATRIGYPVALAIAALAALGFVLGITTPLRSGAFCTGQCMAYPYAEAGQFFPRDYLWMFAAILLTPLFTVAVSCVHFCVPARCKPWSLLALCFACISTVIVTMDYFLQALVVQASLAHRETEGVALLTQYNPHGLFIALEDLGYLILAASFFLIAFAIPRSVRPGRTIAWTLGTAAVLAGTAFLFMAVRFGVEMGLPFELAIIMIDWFALIIGGIQLSVFFVRARHVDFSR